jgi:hypothetical protein
MVKNSTRTKCFRPYPALSDRGFGSVQGVQWWWLGLKKILYLLCDYFPSRALANPCVIASGQHPARPSCQFPRHCERLQAARQSMMGVASGRSDFGQLIRVPRCFFLDCFPLRCARGRNDGGNVSEGGGKTEWGWKSQQFCSRSQ